MDAVVDHPALTWYRERPRKAYTLVMSAATTPILGPASRIGGFPFLPVDELWPICSQCGVTLFFVGQFGRDIEPFVLPHGAELLCVYKCGNMDCDSWYGNYTGTQFFHLYGLPLPSDLQTPVSGWDCRDVYPPPGIAFDRGAPKNRSIAVEVPRQYSVSVGDRFTDFPGWEENKLCWEIDRPVLHQYMELYPKAGAKVLGHPKWEQGTRYPECRCGKTMRHLLQLELPHVDLGDCGRMHLFHCEDWCCDAASLAVSWACG